VRIIPKKINCFPVVRFSAPNPGENGSRRPQKIGIALPQTQRRKEDPSLVPPAWMTGIKTVVPKLRDLNNCG
jgi:hypothetical protein